MTLWAKWVVIGASMCCIDDLDGFSTEKRCDVNGMCFYKLVHHYKKGKIST